ncbi:putative Beta-glucoside operon antiterminator [Microbacterium sp. 8M]|uniref:PRD domain-containing protein n=1 Tax=Microbacterium sp. 8M TaxID=2653153 RepID=UPI0012F2BD9F|nr:PRD domain-containing protein [Microbacterium sp. 8M]VXC02366.1 putative Beta-glucoside operon antiterminator [Microbacterium sp. 8M]
MVHVMTQAHEMIIKRVIGNNAVLALDENDRQFVALGRGVGFGSRQGDPIDTKKVEQVFLASEDAASSRLVEVLTETPLECVRAAARIADNANERLGLRVSQSLILPLADHLHFAMQRAVEGTTMEFPLQWEVRQLYPAEYAVGQEGVRIADEVMKVHLDPAEAVALAMHLVNAQFATPGVGAAMQMTETIARIFDVIEKTFEIRLDRYSMNAARFVTHLRYVFARVSTDKQISDPHPTLFDAISHAHPEAMACALKVRYLIEMAFKTSLTADETAYLGLHVARLVMDVREAVPD